jgi:hypothetical protein
MEPTHPAQYQTGSGHLIELSIVGNMSLVQFWTSTAAETSQTRPLKFLIFFMLNQIHTLEGWNQLYQLLWPNLR